MTTNTADERPSAMGAQLVIRISEAERDALAERAAADDRPLASYARRVLRGHLASPSEAPSA